MQIFLSYQSELDELRTLIKVATFRLIANKKWVDLADVHQEVCTSLMQRFYREKRREVLDVKLPLEEPLSFIQEIVICVMAFVVYFAFRLQEIVLENCRLLCHVVRQQEGHWAIALKVILWLPARSRDKAQQGIAKTEPRLLLPSLAHRQ